MPWPVSSSRVSDLAPGTASFPRGRLKPFVISIFVILAPALIFAAPPESTSSNAAHPGARFTCLMHPQVIRDAPGDCPICGMPLVPLKQERTSHELRETGEKNPVDTHQADEHAMSMSSSINVAEPMTREGSGTSWLPDSSPVYGKMFMLDGDMLMLHGAIFPRYTNVGTSRGDDRIDAPNWFMAMYGHSLGEDTQIGLRSMMSLDPLTEGGRGYPLLFQTGESWHDQALHDRQHPHDLFDELSFSLSQRFTDALSAFLYFGYPGEPALGPPTFMHRPSAMDMPDAPLSHHWQDSTHVTFGVATAGLVWRNFKLEGSVFTGREPDEDRYDFDTPRFDSASVRFSWNPTPDWALQVSHGYIASPEALDPKMNEHRTTASVIYNHRFGKDVNWANSFVWGQDDFTGEGKSQSFLFETDLQWQRETLFSRFEHVQKSGNELVLQGPDLERLYGINAWSIGVLHDFRHGTGIDVGLGTELTIDFYPDSLRRYYGDSPAFGVQVFLRIRPSQIHPDAMDHMGHMQ